MEKKHQNCQKPCKYWGKHTKTTQKQQKCGKNVEKTHLKSLKRSKLAKTAVQIVFFGGVAGKNPVNNGVKRPTRERPNGTPHLRIAYFGGF